MSARRESYVEVTADGLTREQDGISVVVASYRPASETLKSLESIADQTLDPSRFEVVLVVNGPASADIASYEQFKADHPHVRLKVARTPLEGACHALNLGISMARMNWVTFVDDDDVISPRFLEGLLAVAGPSLIPLTRIDDVTPEGATNKKNRINNQITPLLGRVVPPEKVARGLTFNAAKLIPTDWARHVGYDNRLASGQDIAFYAGLYANYDFSFAIVPEEFDSIYVRSLSDTSQSRRGLDFEFSVLERLAVIESVFESVAIAPPSKRPVLMSMIRAQAMFMRRFLDSNPQERDRVSTTIRQLNLADFPWDVLTEGNARTLVVSVCFPPFSDPSAVTVAKRIRQSGELVDVLSCDMSSFRTVDRTLEQLVAGLVGSVTQVPSDMSFANWSTIEDFVEKGWNMVAHLDEWPYDRIYSRAMWPASHILAGYIKIQQPSVRWVAEFSDPLSRDVRGLPRPGGELERGYLLEELEAAIEPPDGPRIPTPANLFELSEVLPYALADELVFTNENQLGYMLSYCRSRHLAEAARKKSVISPHPVPPREFYELLESAANPAPGRANLAYFGSFYENRSLVDLIEALELIDDNVRDRIALDIYSDQGSKLEDLRARRNLTEVMTIREPVGYLEFLNLTTKYDCLLVEDTASRGTHEVNPYLPSKWSDYAGSGTPVWAFVEPGSTLSKMDVAYTTELSDIEGCVTTLETLAQRFGDGSGSGSGQRTGTGAPNNAEVRTK